MKRLIATIIGAALLLPIVSSDVFAQRFRNVPDYRLGNGPYFYEKRSASRQPRRGYEGFYPGLPNLYCSYQRRPIRTCNRRGRCSVKRWEMFEYCY